MTNGNESVFPDMQETPQFNHHTYGLSKREYFAAMAMQGLMANPATINVDGEYLTANAAVKIADKLIKALNEEA